MFENITFDMVVHRLIHHLPVDPADMAVAHQFAMDNDMSVADSVVKKWNANHSHRMNHFMCLSVGRPL